MLLFSLFSSLQQCLDIVSGFEKQGEAKDQAIPDMTRHAPSDASNSTPTTGNPEVDKKIRNIRKVMENNSLNSTVTEQHEYFL